MPRTISRTDGSPANEPLRRAIAACRTGFGAALCFSFGVSALMLVAPLYMLQIYDRVITSRSVESLVLLTVIAGVALITLAALDVVRGFVLIRIGAWLDRQLAPLLLTTGISSAMGAGAAPSVQGLRDLGTVRTFLSSPLIFAFFDAPWTPIFLIVIFMLHWLLGIVAVVGAAVLLALSFINEMITRRDLEEAGNMAIRNLQHAEATVRNADAVSAMGMLPTLVDRWRADAAHTDRVRSRALSRVTTIGSMSKALRLALQIAMLGTGAYLVMQVDLTAGAMIASAILMTRALAPAEQAINGWRAAASARDSYSRLKKGLAEARAPRDAMPLPRPEGRLAAEAATFFFPGQTQPTLREVSFALKPGERLGIIGPSAAGKTTLARMLVGNLTPRLGHVRLDGADIAQWEAKDRGPHIGYVPQDVELFAGTVRENIARMTQGDTNSVIEAARIAGVSELIMHLPSAYETEIGPGGMALSAGQRQRIALARAFYGDPRLVVLDEPNANLDQAGESALVEAIGRIRTRGTTLVLVTHSASLIRQVDKLLVLVNGMVRHFGPRDEVLAKLGAVPRRMTAIGAESEC